jgi:hypothetical protein
VEIKIYYEHIAEFNKLKEANQKIKVFFEEEDVERVTTTRIWLWNNGRRPVKKEDIPDDEKLHLDFEDVKESGSNPIKILDHDIIKCSRDSMNFRTVIKPPNKVGLEFDNMDGKEGAAIEIQHTGSDKSLLDFKGIILGPKTKPKIKGDVYYSKFRRKTKFRSFIEKNADKLSIPILLTIIFSFIFIYDNYLDRKISLFGSGTQENGYYNSSTDLFDAMYELSMQRLNVNREVLSLVLFKDSIKNSDTSLVLADSLDALRSTSKMLNDSANVIDSLIDDVKIRHDIKKSTLTINWAFNWPIFASITLMTIFVFLLFYLKYPRYPKELHIY